MDLVSLMVAERAVGRPTRLENEVPRKGPGSTPNATANWNVDSSGTSAVC